MNYYEAQQGDLYFDDYHIKEINRTILRNRIAYVSQESFFLVLLFLIIYVLV